MSLVVWFVVCLHFMSFGMTSETTFVVFCRNFDGLTSVTLGGFICGCGVDIAMSR